MAERAGALPGVAVAAPVLRENVTLIGSRGAQEAVQLIGVSPSVESLGGAASQEYGAAATALLQAASGCPPAWRARSACAAARCLGWRATGPCTARG